MAMEWSGDEILQMAVQKERNGRGSKGAKHRACIMGGYALGGTNAFIRKLKQIITRIIEGGSRDHPVSFSTILTAIRERDRGERCPERIAHVRPLIHHHLWRNCHASHRDKTGHLLDRGQ